MSCIFLRLIQPIVMLWRAVVQCEQLHSVCLLYISTFSLKSVRFGSYSALPCLTVGAIIFENHIINHAFLSVFKWGLPTSTSIFSAISASIFKISVPIIKRRSSGFRNTPRSHLSDEYWPRKQQKTKWQPKLNIKNILGKIYLL